MSPSYPCVTFYVAPCLRDQCRLLQKGEETQIELKIKVSLPLDLPSQSGLEVLVHRVGQENPKQEADKLLSFVGVLRTGNISIGVNLQE